MNFDAAFDLLLEHEGGYVNDERDLGGETRFGITVAVAREFGYEGVMRELPLEVARKIYRDRYWDATVIDGMPLELRFDVFDAAVHSGPKRAIKWLQMAAKTEATGELDTQTWLAVRFADPRQLTRRFNGHRLQFLTSLKGWKHFGQGWARRVAKNLTRE